MITVLSCCDLMAALTNMPLAAFIAMLWLTGGLNVHTTWPNFVLTLAAALQISSLLALLVMNFDRYLATSYPLFHRTSVKMRRLSTRLGILITNELTLTAMSAGGVNISFQAHILIVFILLTLAPMLFINSKLFLVIRRRRRNSGISSKKKKTISLTNISSCLIAVACYVVLSNNPFSNYSYLFRRATYLFSLSIDEIIIGDF